jgi:pSer/pThr/pTyr-binding forkhead associated (FHA) protein
MPVQVRLLERGTTAAQTREIPITQPEFVIGRGADCDLRLRDDAVSRHHCILRLLGPEASVVDLGSSNGTFVNDHRIRSQATLQSGDRLRVGASTFVVDLGDGKAAELGVADVDPIAPTRPILEPPERKKRSGGK